MSPLIIFKDMEITVLKSTWFILYHFFFVFFFEEVKMNGKAHVIMNPPRQYIYFFELVPNPFQ